MKGSRSTSKGGADAGELRRQLRQARTQISDLEEELQEKNNLYQAAIQERDAGKARVAQAEEALGNVESLVAAKVAQVRNKEGGKLKEKEGEVKQLRTKVSELEGTIRELKSRLERAPSVKPGAGGDGGTASDYAKELAEKERELQKSQKYCNYLQDQVEDFMAENKFLRSMGDGIPDNFGKEREKVKLKDKAIIDDYKKLARVLQEDNYKLEAERAKLKHKIKQLVSSGSKNTAPVSMDGVRDLEKLSESQREKVNDFIWRLQASNVYEDEELDPFTLLQENRALKSANAELREATQRGYGFIREELERLMTQNVPKGGAGLSPEDLQALNAAQAETRAKLDELVPLILKAAAAGEQSAASLQNQSQQFSAQMMNAPMNAPLNATGTTGSIPQPSILMERLRPPVPRMNPDNTVSQGYSYKFDTKLLVTGRDGEEIGLGKEADPQENAFLQLQLQECFELLKRKDSALGAQKKEIDNLYARMKKYILTQDHLYKDFVAMENKHATQTAELRDAAIRAEQGQKQAKERADRQQAAMEALKQGIDANRLVELTKENALLEEQLITMTRKCQAVEDELKLRTYNYDAMEKEMGDMDAAYQDKIARLKETQRRQTLQLKQLYEKLRVAVPIAEYDAAQRALETCKQRQGDLFVRTKHWATKVSELQIKVREGQDAIRDRQDQQASHADLEKEFSIIRSRLEALDGNYARENQLFGRIVEALRRCSVTARGACEYFDEDQDGVLSRGEFERALTQMGLYGSGPDSLNNQEIDALIKAIDLDGDGRIQYSEFERKLQRCGLKTLTRQEQLMQTIVKGLQATGRTPASLFRLINKDGSGFASRQDFKDMLTSLNLPGASPEELEKFIEYFYEDESRGSRVSSRAFLEAFTRLEKQLTSDAGPRGGANAEKRRRRVPRNILERKQEIFRQIDFALNKAGRSIADLFKRVDTDGSRAIDADELLKMLTGMQVRCTPDEARQIFDSIDEDMSGTIQLSELQHDYHKCIKRTLDQLVDEENTLHRAGDQEDFGALTAGYRATQGQDTGGGIGKGREIELMTRIKRYEYQCESFKAQVQNLREIKEECDKALHLAMKRGDELKAQNDRCKEAFFTQQEQIEKLKAQLDLSVSKGDSERIQAENERLKTELSDAQGALMSAKRMQAVIGEQVKSLKLLHERKKDENESLANAVRDLQAKDFNEQKWGKLYQVVMLSRWQESAVNKKYKAKQEETAKLEAEALSLAQQLENCRDRLYAAEQEQLRTSKQVRDLKNELSERSNPFWSVEVGEDFSRSIAELTEERTKLEERYFKARSDQVQAQDSVDTWKSKAEAAEALLLQLRTGGPDTLSAKLMAMSTSLQEAKLAAMKAERKVRELGERENYLGKLLKGREDEVTSLGEKLALREKEFAQAEEKWRLVDNQRIQEFYNPKFGQDPNAMAKGGLTTAPTTSMAFATMGPQPGLSENAAPMDRQKIREQDELIQRLRAKLESAEARLEQREEQDKAMGGNATVQSFDVQAHAKMNLEKYQDEEKEQMRVAANETIRTLHKMLTEKNKSLSQKESTIVTLRDEMAEERKRAADRYAELQRQYTDEGKSTLAGLQRIVSSNKQEPERFQPDPALNEVGKQSEVALRRAQDQLRQLQADLEDKQAELQEARAMAAGERARTKEIQASSDKTVKGLEAEVQAWKTKAASIEKAREEKNQAIIKRFDEKLLEYHKDKLRLEDDLKQARMKAVTEVSMRDRAKLSHKPSKEAAKAGTAASAKKEGPKGTDDDFLAIIKKGPSRETQDELIEICRKKDAELRTLGAEAKKSKDTVAKLTKEKEDAQKDWQKKLEKHEEEKAKWQEQTRVARDDEKAEKERRQELERDWNKLRAEMQGGPGAGTASYAEMGERIKQLEKENFVLESQKQPTVVAYNPQTSTYEYIGVPLPLQTQRDASGGAARDRAGQPIAVPLGTAEEIVAALKSWFRLGVNDRLSVKQVFESLDLDRFGELGGDDFQKALARLGVSLQPGEQQILAQALDPSKAGYLGYRALVRELEGVPQSLFMHAGLVKLAEVAVERDLTPTALTSLLSGSAAPGATMTLEGLQRNFAEAEARDFRFTKQEVQSIFAYITGAKGSRVDGLKIEIDALVRKAFLGVHAILIERVRAALEHAGKTVAQIFAERDPKNVGFLDREQLSLAFSAVMKKRLEKNMRNTLFTDVFKPGNSKGNTSGKISQSLLKFYLETFAPGSQAAPAKSAVSQQIDSSKGRAKPEAPAGGNQPLGVSPEMLQTSKRAARKILLQCHSNIVELVGKLDHLEEGIVNKQELKRAILEQKVKELDEEELNVLLKLCDKGLKGYVSTNKVIEQLYALSNESECDVILRRLSKTLAHQDVNLAKALSAYETSVGTVEIPAFKKCLQGLACALTEQEISKVANEVCVPMTSTINVKQFVKQAAEAGKTQPLPNYITQGPRGSNAAGKGGKGNPMAAFDAEKKYKKNLEALKNEIEEKNREAQGLRTEVKICHDRYNRLDQECKNLEAKLLAKHTKPPRETANEALAFGQAQELKQLKEQLNYAQEENTKLNKTIDVQLKSEINRLGQEKDDLQEKISELKGQVGQLNTVINRIHGQSLDNVEKREELGLFRQLRIEELEKQLEESEAAKAETQDQLFAAQENVLDLKFEKETYDLQYARLQKRIQVLEQYKMSSNQLSAAIDNEAKKDLQEIHEIAGATASTRKSANDNVKMKFSKGKNSSELEMVVESLKRVVEKLKTENDHLKKENSKYAGQSGQASLEKSLRQKISNLETVVASHEMKEINLDEKQKTIKKLIDAHKNLQEDLHKEQDRYMLLEKKYKDVLVKFNISDQENARNEELIFGMQTGSNMNRFRGFLAEKDEKDKYR